jgi:membrane protease YdiL (CAAX protease family)
MRTIVARRSIAGPAVVVVGAGVLWLRTAAMAETPPAVAPRVALLLLVYGAIAVASAPLLGADEPARLHPMLVAGVGSLAMLIAVAAAGPSAPVAGAAIVLPLSLAAAVSEEMLFRGVAYAELGRWGPVAAVAGSALLFALIHLRAYGPAAMPVDLGAGLLLSWQRWASGSWKIPAATHAAANLLAVMR